MDRYNAWGCETVEGSRSLHSISGFCHRDPGQGGFLVFVMLALGAIGGLVVTRHM